MEIRLRSGNRKDHEYIWRATIETVWNDLPPDERDGVNRAEFEDHFRSRANRVIESPENAVFIAEGSEQEPLGYIIVGAASSMLSRRPFGFVYDLWVAPHVRRHSVASRLLQGAAEWCQERGFAKLKLEVGATNAPARALYASAGFIEERLTLGKAVRA